MSELILSQPTPLPEPTTPMTVRVGTRADMPFMDRLQKAHSKALGFFPRAQMEEYIDAGNVLVAADPKTGEPLGYVASKDRYLKRDELGAVFQLCVAPGHERKFIGANLLREVFARASYGCRLFCCWCAQDLPANRFWEAMGFVPLAFRAGGRGHNSKCRFPIAESGEAGPIQSEIGNRQSSNARVHIFWQKRIRAGDTTTPYWFPAKTEGGAIREDRIILPIPPGMKWTDELPVLRPENGAKMVDKGRRRLLPAKKQSQPKIVQRGSRQFGRPDAAPIAIAPTLPATAAPAPKPVKRKCDPALIAKARELRDRWLEQFNSQSLPPAIGKYDVARIAA